MLKLGVCHPTLSDVFTPVERRKVFKKRPEPNIKTIKLRLLTKVQSMRKLKILQGGVHIESGEP